MSGEEEVAGEDTPNGEGTEASVGRHVHAVHEALKRGIVRYSLVTAVTCSGYRAEARVGWRRD